MFLNLAAAAACVLATVLLGRYVTARGVFPLDVAAARLCFHRCVPVARMFTRLGYSPALTGLFFGLVVCAQTFHIPPAFIALLIVLQLASQTCTNFLKRHFRRVRPSAWLVRLEHTPAYPSGHSVTAIFLFGSLAWLIAGRGVHTILATCCLIVVLIPIPAVAWSRIALGAHYASDVIGGYLLGGATLLLGIALYTTLGLH